MLTEADEVQGLREEKPKEKKEKAKTATGAAVTDAVAGEAGAEGEIKEEGDVTMASATDENAENAENTENAEATEKTGEEKMDDSEIADPNEPVQPEVESADVILDFVDGLDLDTDNIDSKLPKYNCTRPVATSMIAKLTCFECRLCNKYFDSEKTAEIHARTVSHHRQFVKFLNDKANETKIAQKRAAAALEETERRKRQKIDDSTDAEPAVANENGTAVKTELYDPSEATGEDEDENKMNNTSYFDASTNDEKNESINDNGNGADEGNNDETIVAGENGHSDDTKMDEDNKIAEPVIADPAAAVVATEGGVTDATPIKQPQPVQQQPQQQQQQQQNQNQNQIQNQNQNQTPQQSPQNQRNNNMNNNNNNRQQMNNRNNNMNNRRSGRFGGRY